MTIQSLIDCKTLFVANHSGGKDSQAMLIKMLGQYGIPRQQILVIHASLGEVEWHGALELAQQQAADAGLPFVVAHAVDKLGNGKTLLTEVERRFAADPSKPSWPSKSCKSCTSDLKRGPIEREIRRYMKEHGFTRVVNCTGLRADESNDRAKLEPLVFLNEKLGKDGKPTSGLAKAGREAYEWLPIHDLTTEQVFATIADAGQEPHPAYAAGNERLSCVFCIMGSGNDILRGAQARPELFARYVELEQLTGYTMHMSRKSLTQLVAEATLKQAA